jgi:hypothetical protein
MVLLNWALPLIKDYNRRPKPPRATRVRARAERGIKIATGLGRGVPHVLSLRNLQLPLHFLTAGKLEVLHRQSHLQGILVDPELVAHDFKRTFGVGLRFRPK